MKHFFSEKANLKKVKLLIVVYFTLSNLSAQHWQWQKDLLLKKTTTAAIDRNKNIYIADEQGNVFKTDTLGNILLQYTAQMPNEVHTIESWLTMKTLLFYQITQQIVILNRFLQQPITWELPPEQVGFAQAANWSADEQVWIFDVSDFHLKKFHLNTQEVTFAIALDVIWKKKNSQVLYLKEYQNQVFLCDETLGIACFDLLGNHKYTLPFLGIKHIGVAGNQIYFLQENTLVFFDLYEKTIQKWELPEKKQPKFAIYVDSFVFLAFESEIQLYKVFP
ncbi:MAG: hypothetical protein EAZ55_13680 [Cytophagales bacterium]|nr:MAG: hypothetical protein EAZ55_13680 [Cytophagales bacterium]